MTTQCKWGQVTPNISPRTTAAHVSVTLNTSLPAFCHFITVPRLLRSVRSWLCVACLYRWQKTLRREPLTQTPFVCLQWVNNIIQREFSCEETSCLSWYDTARNHMHFCDTAVQSSTFNRFSVQPFEKSEGKGILGVKCKLARHE